MAKQTKKRGAFSGARRKKLLIPIAVLLPVIGILCYAILTMEREPLTAKEILEKSEWQRDELERALSRSFQLNSDRESRHEVTQHLRRQLENFSPEEQRRIRTAALIEALHHSLDQFRLLEEKDRQRILSRMNEQADRNYEKIRTMNQSERSQLREEISSEEGKEIMTEVNRIMTGKMTPEERSEFMPLTQKWLKTMQRL